MLFIGFIMKNIQEIKLSEKIQILQYIFYYTNTIILIFFFHPNQIISI